MQWGYFFGFSFILTISGRTRYAYMIDNIVLLITGTLHQRAIGDLLPRCHPLGSFEQLGAITVADTPAQLYTAVLVDTPLGKSFDVLLKNYFTYYSSSALFHRLYF
jgi:vacuolar-type H+-ATPase subunit C/Vma6